MYSVKRFLTPRGVGSALISLTVSVQSFGHLLDSNNDFDMSTQEQVVVTHPGSRSLCSQVFGVGRNPTYVYESSSGEIFTLNLTKVSDSNVFESTTATASPQSASGSSPKFEKLLLDANSIEAMCAAGIRLTALPQDISDEINLSAQPPSTMQQNRKAAVNIVTAIPTAFDINLYNFFGTWMNVGSMYLPQAMPFGTSVQWSNFQLQTSGLNNSGTHFAHGLLTWAQGNDLGNGFSGNGMIIGHLTPFASCNSAGPNLSLIEAWRTYPTNPNARANFVYTGGDSNGQPILTVNPPDAQYSYAPRTCAPHTDGVTRTYGVQAGTNRWMFYGVWPNGFNAPYSYLSPSVLTPNAPALISGQAGIFFGLAGNVSLTGQQITLSFTNVQHGAF
jgi:hypothetical protein